MNPQIILAESDARRLRTLLNSPPKGLDRDSLDWLRQEMEHARIVPDGQVPEDVITLNSTAEIEDLTDGEVDTFTLVDPSEANPAHGKVSLLAPLGMGMIGFRAGDEFEWPLPGGTARYRIRRLVENPRRAASHTA